MEQSVFYTTTYLVTGLVYRKLNKKKTCYVDEPFLYDQYKKLKKYKMMATTFLSCAASLRRK